MMRNQRVMMICIMLLLALASAGPAMAAPEQPAPLMGVTITVTSTADDLSANGNCTLREAIQAANTDKQVDRCPAGSGSDTIKLGTHTYKMTRAGRLENANKTGDYDITSSVTIVGTGMGKTIIELGKIDRAFDVRSTTATVALQDMTIQHGFTDVTGTNTTPDHGGAVANRATMTMTRVQFRDNAVTGDVYEMGGAVSNEGKLTITGAKFSGNTSESYGGAIGNSGTLVVYKTNFTSNEGLVGGALYNAPGGSMKVDQTTKFNENNCGPGNGAAIYNRGALTVQASYFAFNKGDGGVIESVSGSATVRYSTFISNRTSSGALLDAGGPMTVSHSIISSNTSDFDNYGQLTANGSSMVIDRSTIISSNIAPALVVRSGAVRIANSTFAHNASDTCAGAICVLGGTGVSLESVTIAWTGVTAGIGAISTQPGVALRLHNTLITKTVKFETIDSVPDCVNQPSSLVSQGYNLVSVGDGCGWTAATGDQVGTLAAPIDAQLKGFTNYGGPTPTYALLSTSPAINAADPALTVKTDQRMYKRPAGPRPDIGAFEYGAVAP